MNDYKQIDFVPVDNNSYVVERIRDWLKANVSHLLRSQRYIDEFDGDHLYLEIGGYTPYPLDSDKIASATANFSLGSRFLSREDSVLDSEGTVWHLSTLSAEAYWPSYGSQTAGLARIRANMINTAVTLAERFNEEFSHIKLWTKGQTKDERDASNRQFKRSSTINKVHDHIKQAIHTSCTRMRVGHERFIDPPEGDLIPGEYVVVVENKTYRVTLREADAIVRFQFCRVK